MDPVQAAPGVYEGVANVIAAVMLLLEFGMLRQALARDQIRLYMAQSALISVLAVVIAADRNLPDLYVLAALSAALKVVAVPLVMRRLLGRTDPDEGEEAPGVGRQPHAEPGQRRAGGDRAGGVSGSSASARSRSTAPPPPPWRWPSPPRWCWSRSA